MKIQLIRGPPKAYVIQICYSITHTAQLFEIARGLGIVEEMIWNGPTNITPIVPQITIVSHSIGSLKRFISECKRQKILF